MAVPFAFLLPIALAMPNGALAQADDEVTLPPTTVDDPPVPPAAPPSPDAPPPAPSGVGPCYDPPKVIDDEELWANRTMKGHTFLYPTLFDSAFVASYVGVRAGVTQRSIPEVVGATRNFDLNLVGVAETLDLGLKITDWLGLQATGGGRAIIGSNIPALVYDGATYAYEGRLAAVFRLMRLRSTGTQLSASISGSYLSGQIVSLAPLLTAADASTALQTLVDGNLGDALRTPIRSIDGRVSLLFAQALGRLVSIQAAAAVGRHSVRIEPFDPNAGVRGEIDVGGFQYLGAAGVALDGAAFHVPIGGMIEYSVSRVPSTTSLSPGAELETIHRSAGSVYFTGSRHLQTGVGVSWEGGLNPLRTSDGVSGRPDSKSASFILRYVW